MLCRRSSPKTWSTSKPPFFVKFWSTDCGYRWFKWWMQTNEDGYGRDQTWCQPICSNVGLFLTINVYLSGCSQMLNLQPCVDMALPPLLPLLTPPLSHPFYRNIRRFQQQARPVMMKLEKHFRQKECCTHIWAQKEYDNGATLNFVCLEKLIMNVHEIRPWWWVSTDTR
jgi:hypothetical protein